MIVRVKLFASLSDYLPAPRKGNQIDREFAPGTSVAEAIAAFGVPAARAHLVLVNGVFVPPGNRAGFLLSEGDELALWPPVAGG